mmetsp:Transcript_72860/g.152131  ORF Transcript_72860/g.152131 Transcript_72860/m.152131 type:complete len:229 (+) Transcript_72860:224-910(+)
MALAQVGVASLYTFLILVALLSAVGVSIWIWGNFLDKHEHDPARVRAMMFLILCTTVGTELGLHAATLTTMSAALTSLVVAVWGGVDALLRFPASHELESLFAAKQFSLLIFKTVVYVIGMSNFRSHLAVFMLVFAWTWLMPVLYAMALPMDPFEQVLQNDANDVDVAVRMWRLAVNTHERKTCLVSCRAWWYRNLTVASERSTIIRYALCAASPEHRRFFTKKVRSV